MGLTAVLCRLPPPGASTALVGTSAVCLCHCPQQRQRCGSWRTRWRQLGGTSPLVCGRRRWRRRRAPTRPSTSAPGVSGSSCQPSPPCWAPHCLCLALAQQAGGMQGADPPVRKGAWWVLLRIPQRREAYERRRLRRLSAGPPGQSAGSRTFLGIDSWRAGVVGGTGASRIVPPVGCVAGLAGAGRLPGGAGRPS